MPTPVANYSLPGGPIKLQIAKLTENATIPTRGSARAAGYDLYSAEVSSVCHLL